jgi:mRNA-degrading endonuclease toxin of MazEF toxin-antitoxin module
LTHIGNIHLARIYYRGRSGASKIRPVVVIREQGNRGLYTIIEVTSVAPKQHPGFFDRYKEKVGHRGSTGLVEESYVKCHHDNIHRVKEYRLHKRLGRIEQEDVHRILLRIAKVKVSH